MLKYRYIHSMQRSNSYQSQLLYKLMQDTLEPHAECGAGYNKVSSSIAIFMLYYLLRL